MAKYKILELCIFDQENSLYIPYDEDNRDYREYLNWLAEGNTPDPLEPEE